MGVWKWTGVLALSGESKNIYGEGNLGELGLDRYRLVHQRTRISQGWEGTCHVGTMPSSSVSMG